MTGKQKLCSMTASQLLEACESAHLQCLLMTETSKGKCIGETIPYVVSPCHIVCNAELDEMNDLYLQFFNDPVCWDRLMCIIKNLQPGGANAALKFIEYPLQVIKSRIGTESGSPETFQLKSIVRSICAKSDLLTWSREILDSDSAQNDLLESAVMILHSALLFGKRVQTSVLPIILREGEDCLDALFVRISAFLERRWCPQLALFESPHQTQSSPD